MTFDRKFEPYRLIPEGHLYKIENFDAENLMSDNENKISKINKSKTKNVMDFTKSMKKNVTHTKGKIKKINQNPIEYLKSFFDGLIFVKKGIHSFKVNDFTFFNALNIYNFLFKNSKKISGIDILKLRNLLKHIKMKMFEKICKNAKNVLKE
jgi:hypothetical protein